jgi:hypothetical protein
MDNTSLKRQGMPAKVYIQMTLLDMGLAATKSEQATTRASTLDWISKQTGELSVSPHA